MRGRVAQATEACSPLELKLHHATQPAKPPDASLNSRPASLPAARCRLAVERSAVLLAQLPQRACVMAHPVDVPDASSRQQQTACATTMPFPRAVAGAWHGGGHGEQLRPAVGPLAEAGSSRWRAGQNAAIRVGNPAGTRPAAYWPAVGPGQLDGHALTRANIRHHGMDPKSPLVIT